MSNKMNKHFLPSLEISAFDDFYKPPLENSLTTFHEIQSKIYVKEFQFVVLLYQLNYKFVKLFSYVQLDL